VKYHAHGLTLTSFPARLLSLPPHFSDEKPDQDMEASPVKKVAGHTKVDPCLTPYCFTVGPELSTSTFSVLEHLLKKNSEYVRGSIQYSRLVLYGWISR